MSDKIDPSEVLTSYTSLLLEGNDAVVRDAGDLPYPKDVIKQVLVYCIRIASEKNRPFLLGAYVGLAIFQPLTKEQKEAIDTSVWLANLEDPTALSNAELKDAAAKVAKVQPIVTEITQRISEESAALVDELKTAGV